MPFFDIAKFNPNLQVVPTVDVPTKLFLEMKQATLEQLSHSWIVYIILYISISLDIDILYTEGH